MKKMMNDGNNRKTQIKIKLSDISLLSKGAHGTKSIKITESARVVGMTIF